MSSVQGMAQMQRCCLAMFRRRYLVHARGIENKSYIYTFLNSVSILHIVLLDSPGSGVADFSVIGRPCRINCRDLNSRFSAQARLRTSLLSHISF